MSSGAVLSLGDLLHFRSAAEVDAEQLHHLFQGFFFGAAVDASSPDVAADEGPSSDDDDAITEELLRRGASASSDDDQGTIADTAYEDYLEELDARADAEGASVNGEFMRWISEDPVFSSPITQPERLAQELRHAQIQRQLDQHQLEPDAPKHRDVPSRLVDAAEGASAATVAEARWILMQLCEPGYPLHGAPVAHDWSERRQVIVKEIVAMIDFMVFSHFEPAHLAMYARDTCTALLGALREAARGRFGTPYSLATGRHHIEEQTQYSEGIGSVSRSRSATPGGAYLIARTPSIRSVDGSWNVTQPAEVHLGRVLWHVWELRKEYRRIVMVHEQSQAVLGAHDASLVKMFDSPFEVYAWHQYTRWYRSFTSSTRDEAKAEWLENHSPSFEILWRGERSALSDFAPIPLVGGGFRPMTKSEQPEQWANKYINEEEQCDGEQNTPELLLRRCASATVEHLSLLPSLLVKAYKAYVTAGVLVFKPAPASNERDMRLSVQAALSETQGALLQLLEMHKNHSGCLQIMVNKNALRDALQMDQWLDRAVSSDTETSVRESWVPMLRRVASMVVTKIMQTVESQLMNALRRAAEQFVIACATENLGYLCEVGPYERCELPLADVRQGPLWEAKWNNVESVPFHARGRFAYHPCCGVFRQGSLTWFAIINKHGIPCDSVTWVDTADNSDDGMRAKIQQDERLLLALNQHNVRVIAVGVCGPQSSRLYASISRFLNEHVARLTVAPQVVWQSTRVASVAARSEASLAELPGASFEQRSAVAIAQSLQEPLHLIARTFDRKNLALELPIGSEAARRAGLSTSRVIKWLRYEMTLWVTACGVDINDLIQRSSPECTLQFVAGMDLISARNLVQVIERVHEGMVKNREQLEATFEAKVVAMNAVSSLRVYSAEAGALDGTLIPRPLYTVAMEIACRVWNISPILGELAIERTASEDLNRVVQQLDQLNQSWGADLLRQHVDQDPNVFDWMGGLPEHFPHSLRFLFNLILNEFVAVGRVTMRRPYRSLTRELFFEEGSGVSFIEDASAVAGNENDRDFSCVQRGQLLDGVLERIVIPPNPADVERTSIIVKLSCGLRGVIGMRDVPNEVVSRELRRFAVECSTCKDQQVVTSKSSKLIPQLQPDSAVCAIVLAPIFENCELRLQWVDPRPADTTQEQLLASQRHRISTHSSVTANGTVRTAQLVEQAAVTALLFTTHPRYRDWDNDRTARELADLRIGEYVVRRSQSGGHFFVIAVRVSEERHDDKASGVFNLRCREKREPSGRLVYIVLNFGPREKNYDSVEHVVTALIRSSLMRFVTELREHDKFRLNPTLAAQSFVEELQFADRLVYAIVQRTTSDSSHYAIVYRTRDLAMHYRPISVTYDSLAILTKQRGQVNTGTVDELIGAFKLDFQNGGKKRG